MKYLKLFEQFINEARAPKELPLINKIFGDPGDPKDVPGGKKTYSSYIENIEKQLRSQLPSDFKNLWLNSVDLLTTKKAFTNLGNCSFTRFDNFFLFCIKMVLFYYFYFCCFSCCCLLFNSICSLYLCLRNS